MNYPIKKIWQIWHQGSDKIPERIKKMQETWTSKNPDFQYTLLDDKAMKKIVSGYSGKCLELYENYPHIVQKCALAQFVVLYQHGGFYADIDSVCFRSIEEFITIFKFKLTITQNPLSWFETYMSWGLSVILNTGMMYSPPGHVLLKKVIDQLIEIGNIEDESKYQTILQTTSFYNFSKILKDDLHHDGLEIVSADYFEPCFCNIFCKPDEEESYAWHQLEKSWVSFEQRIVSDIYFLSRPYFGHMFIFFITIFLMFLCYVLYIH